MSRGRRTSDERKLNLKKVFACILIPIIIALFVFAVNKMLEANKNQANKKIETTYHLIYQNKKWGVIKNDGNIIIQPEYDEMIQIPDEKTALFICTYDVNYETGSYETKVLNEKAEEILKEYNKVIAINNFTNTENWYEENVLRYEKDNLYGIIDYTGKVIIDAIYEEILPMIGVKNTVILKRDSKLGVATTTGTILVQLDTYEDFKGVNIENAYIFRKENKYGIINTEDEILLENNYTEIKQFSTKDIMIAKDTKWKIFNSEKTELIPDKYDDFDGINGNWVIVKKSNQYGVIELTEPENIAIKIEYDAITHAVDSNYIVVKGDKFGVVNSAGETKIEAIYDNITYREDIGCLECETNEIAEANIYNKKIEKVATGIILEVNVEKAYIKLKEANEYRYYNLNFEEKTNIQALNTNTIFAKKEGNKFGFVDKDNNTIIEPQYDDVTEQNKYGYAGIKKADLWGVIDLNGKTIIEPTYTIYNNNNINFIEQWYEITNNGFVFYTK